MHQLTHSLQSLPEKRTPRVFPLTQFQITNANAERAAAILDDIENSQNSITTHDIPIGKFLQAVFKGQLGQVHEAIEILEADIDIMKENGNLWLYPAANLEYGNMLRLEGKLSLFRRSGPALRSGER